MISFIKHDKYISLVNIIVVIIFLLFNVSYYYFLLLELTIIMLYLIFILYRFYLRSRIKSDDMDKIKELYKLDLKYEDYKDIYEEEDTFELEIGEYKSFIDGILVRVLRMDNKLNIDGYDILDQGLDNLEKNIQHDKKRKKNYELIKEVISIIKKYYDKDCNRKENILKHKRLLIICSVLTIVSLLFLTIYFIFDNIELYSIVSSIFIVVLLVVNLFLSGYNKE